MSSTDELIDLRSDTVTKPSEGMRAAMAAAPVGDDVYNEDPEVARLEAEVAELLGHEAGLFSPTGSLANWLALRVHTAPGDEVLCDAEAHIVRAELGAHATLGHITTRTWPTDAAIGRPRGEIDVDAVARMIAPATNPYLVGTRVISVENTHNLAGGTPQPLTCLRRLQLVADRHDVAVHMDGARLWNACAATGTRPRDYGNRVTTASVCLSKGLGAPIGSVLTGPEDFIKEARVWRKRAGAGMRQVGILAAAGRYALKHHRENLPRDHAHARIIAEACHAACEDSVDLDAVTTNIVLLTVSDAPRFVQAAEQQGVLSMAFTDTVVRVMTHRDVAPAQAYHASRVLAELIGQDNEHR